MKLEDLRVACEHGQYVEHFRPFEVYVCPGGRPATPADLGGRQVDIVWTNSVTYDRRIYTADDTEGEVEEGRYLLIPLPDPDTLVIKLEGPLELTTDPPAYDYETEGLGGT